MNWDEAKKYLDKMIKEYQGTWAGWSALSFVLYPLRERLENGERTQELFDEIMAVK